MSSRVLKSLQESFLVHESNRLAIELLSGIPTVVYGYFALLFVTPLLQKVFPSLPGFNMLSAGLVMGIIIVPFINSISEDAMRVVPVELREGSKENLFVCRYVWM